MVIGVLGGMGTYATIDLFRKYAKVFPAEKEWDRPRIIIDNNCTMPSRVRAVLFGENRELLIKEMSNSLVNLLKAGADKLILACNTSHIFLPEIYLLHPELKKTVVSIIDSCVEEAQKKQISSVYLLASEGTLASEVFQDRFNKSGIEYSIPPHETWEDIRCCIEAVKQNRYSDDSYRAFERLIYSRNNVVLGCTELPLMLERIKNEGVKLDGTVFFDPIMIALQRIKDEALC